MSDDTVRPALTPEEWAEAPYNPTGEPAQDGMALDGYRTDGRWDAIMAYANLRRQERGDPGAITREFVALLRDLGQPGAHMASTHYDTQRALADLASALEALLPPEQT